MEMTRGLHKTALVFRYPSVVCRERLNLHCTRKSSQSHDLGSLIEKKHCRRFYGPRGKKKPFFWPLLSRQSLMPFS